MINFIFLQNKIIRHFKLQEKVDVVITDAPLILSWYYGEKLSDSFKNVIKETFNQYDNYNYFLKRTHKYEEIGRTQTEEEANKVGEDIEKTLLLNNINYKTYYTNNNLLNDILKDIYKDLKIN